MNKKSLLFSLVFCISAFLSLMVNSQNLVSNGDLELWDGPNTPTDWDLFDNISRTVAKVHGGEFSAMQISGDGTMKFRQDLTGIEEGMNYTIKYYYYDNDPTARTRIWSYWMNGDDYLDANEDELRPSFYSTNIDGWIEWSVTLTAPPTANAFRFEVRTYKENSQTGGNIFFDDFLFEVQGVHPEPTNYPTGFTATPENLSINLGWIDATGDQLPSAYLVLGNIDGQFTAPVDGSPVDDDTDLSDGAAALNVPYGNESCSFSGLESGTMYYFTIYPYTNGGENIDYKTDGTVPTAEASTSDVLVLNYENFNDTTLDDWIQYSVTGPDQIWYVQEKYGIDDSPNAKMSGYSGGAIENEDWLISPALDGSLKTNETLEFYSASNYDGPVMEVKISSDYAGSGDPNQANWTDLTAALSPGGWEWTYSGMVELKEYAGDSDFYVAFVFFSTDQESATWEVDEILLTAESNIGVDEYPGNEFSLYPNPAEEQVRISGEVNEHSVVIIHDLNGKMVMHTNVPTDKILDVSCLDKGLYLLTITSDSSSRVFVQKLIVQ